MNDAPEPDWVSRLADEVVAAHADASRPIVCASGLSPSGPIHLGNLREVMVPHLVADEIRRRGIACEHILSWDDYDRFRKVPGGIDGLEGWDEHIGKPLTSVPPPPGSTHGSWADHFRAGMIDAMDALGIRVRAISQTEMYRAGAYVEQVLHAMAVRERIDAVLDRYRTKNRDPGVADDADEGERAAAEGSGAAAESDGGGGLGYYPYRPYCAGCGTDLTAITAYDDATTRMTYVCRCGHEETVLLRDHRDGKLVWKVDWPMRWAYEGVDFEPSGVDHQSPGSSYVVGGDLVGPIFGGRQPIGPMYAFVGIKGMAKMSSSRGGVPTPGDALDVMEPPLLRWLYARRKPNQSFQVAFDDEIQRMYDEWDSLGRRVAIDQAQAVEAAGYRRAAATADGPLPVTPHPLPYRALASVADITGGDETQMLRILRAMDPVNPLDSLDDARPRLDRARTWIERYVPDEARTHVRAEPDADLLASLDDDGRESLRLLADGLEEDWTLDGLTTLVYGVPKRMAGFDVHEKKLPPEVKAAQRALFALVYRLLVGRDTGPRLPTLLLSLDPARVRALLGRA
ncbi:MAG: lysine--tRNA ligase [Thermoleophilia bacterium]|nr:lysine--tRNA ligase [Thermoleophilia bacterium]